MSNQRVGEGKERRWDLRPSQRVLTDRPRGRRRLAGLFCGVVDAGLMGQAGGFGRPQGD